MIVRLGELQLVATPVRLAFSRRELRTLRAVVARLLPPMDGPSPDDVTARLAQHLTAQRWAYRAGLRFLLFLIEYLPLLRLTRPFSRLLPDAQDRALRGWEASRLYARRFAMILLKVMAYASFFHDPAAERAFGYGARPMPVLRAEGS